MGQEFIELEKCHVRVGRARKLGQQRGHEFGQQFAGTGTAGGPVPSVVPAPDGVVHRLGVSVSQPGQGFQGFRVRVTAGKNKVSGDGPGGAEGRRVLEQVCIMDFHPVKVGEGGLGKPLQVIVSEKQGQSGQPLGIAGQGVGLFIMSHLQAVFDPAQKPVCGDEVLSRFGGYLLQRGEGAQDLYRFGAAKAGFTAAPDELLGLDKKFDFADAAAAQLDVVAGDRNAGAAPVGVDLALDGMDVLYGGEIKVFAPYKRFQPGQEIVAGFQVAGDGPGLDHRRPLPILSQGFIVGFRRFGGNGQGGGAGVRPEPQVGAKDVSIGCAFVQQLDKATGQPDEIVLKLFRGVSFNAFPVKEDDQVYVAGIIQLARAQFAHGEHDRS